MLIALAVAEELKQTDRIARYILHAQNLEQISDGTAAKPNERIFLETQSYKYEFQLTRCSITINRK